MAYSFFSKSRVETFSDGVFAIIITLLVLEIKVPHIEDHHSVNELGRALVSMCPKFFSWTISFLIVCIIWVNHHRIFERISEIDNQLFWLNANLLFWSSFIPFPTALMGDYADNPLAICVFGIILSMSALGFTLIRMYLRKNPSILQVSSSDIVLKGEVRRSFVFGPVLYWIGAAAAWISPIVSFIIYFLIPVYFIIPRKHTAHEN